MSSSEAARAKQRQQWAERKRRHRHRQNKAVTDAWYATDPYGEREKNPYDSAWERVRLEVIARDGCCLRCGTTEKLQADHIIPISRGGERLDPNNCRTLCASCHAARTNRSRARRKARVPDETEETTRVCEYHGPACGSNHSSCWNDKRYPCLKPEDCATCQHA